MNKELIKSELETIAKRTGTLNPHDVVKFAENPKTALHDCFTWDNTEAAKQWRVHQARMLIRVVVNVISLDDVDKEYRMFVSLKGDRHEGIGYRTLVSILNNEVLKEQMLHDALGEMQVFKSKYKDLKELCEVFEAIEKVEEKIVKRPTQRVASVNT